MVVAFRRGEGEDGESMYVLLPVEKTGKHHKGQLLVPRTHRCMPSQGEGVVHTTIARPASKDRAKKRFHAIRRSTFKRVASQIFGYFWGGQSIVGKALAWLDKWHTRH